MVRRAPAGGVNNHHPLPDYQAADAVCYRICAMAGKRSKELKFLPLKRNLEQLVSDSQPFSAHTVATLYIKN